MPKKSSVKSAVQASVQAQAPSAQADPVTSPVTDESKITLITREGLDKLQDELRYLKEVRRKEVADRIREAISYGDLSENSEYEEAKNEQAFLEGRILELEDKIKYAKIIDEKHKKAGTTVQLGSQVCIQNLGPKAKKDEEFTIVGSTEADPLNHKISNESPIGHALLERKVGDIVRISVPAGSVQYKILKIT